MVVSFAEESDRTCMSEGVLTGIETRGWSFRVQGRNRQHSGARPTDGLGREGSDAGRRPSTV